MIWTSFSKTLAEKMVRYILSFTHLELTEIILTFCSLNLLRLGGERDTWLFQGKQSPRLRLEIDPVKAR